MLNRGHVYSRDFLIQKNGVAEDVTGWEFRCPIMDDVATPVLVELTTANGGFTVIDGGVGRVRMFISPSLHNDLPDGTMHFFVSRTDIVPGPEFMFSGSFKVKTWEG